MTTPEPLPTFYSQRHLTKRLNGVILPFRTRVPIYAIQDLSASATGSCTMPCIPPFAYPFAALTQVSMSFLRALVSPVRLLSSISRSTAVMSLTSAGIRSPVLNVTISPGTSSFASVVIVLPSLRHAQLGLRPDEQGRRSPYEVAMMRHEFVQSFQALLRSPFLYKTNCICISMVKGSIHGWANLLVL